MRFLITESRVRSFASTTTLSTRDWTPSSTEKPAVDMACRRSSRHGRSRQHAYTLHRCKPTVWLGDRIPQASGEYAPLLEPQPGCEVSALKCNSRGRSPLPRREPADLLAFSRRSSRVAQRAAPIRSTYATNMIQGRIDCGSAQSRQHHPLDQYSLGGLARRIHCQY